jgi:N-acetylglutamate synthase-like GNAT family acetyltransferase
MTRYLRSINRGESIDEWKKRMMKLEKIPFIKVSSFQEFSKQGQYDKKTALEYLSTHLHHTCDWSGLKPTADETYSDISSYPSLSLRDLPFQSYFAIEPDGGVVGIGILYIPTPNLGDIHLLCVDEKSQKKGIGAQIIGRIENDAKKLGLKYLTLEAANPDLVHHFYNRFGYTSIEDALVSTNVNIRNLASEVLGERRKAREESIVHLFEERKESKSPRDFRFLLSQELYFSPGKRAPRNRDEFTYANTTGEPNSVLYMIKMLKESTA